MVSFYFMLAVGRNYIYRQVQGETADSLHAAAERLVRSGLINEDDTEVTIQLKRSSFDVAAKAEACQILIISEDGDVILDTESNAWTEKKPYYNVIQNGESDFLHKDATYDYTLGGYLGSPCLCIAEPMRRSESFHGYLVLAYSNNQITSTADYYYNILLTVYFIVIGLLLLTYIGLFFFCFIPLRKLRNGSKDFAIRRDNPPIIIRSNDEYGEMAETLNVLGQELRKFDDYQRKYLSSISHDFRSPLTSIHGYLQAFKDGLIQPEDADHYYDILIAETDRLTKLTNQIIELNSYDRDNILLNVDSFDIHDTIRQVQGALVGRAAKRQIEIKTEMASDEPLFVMGDPEKIHQVLFNLAENAVKFSYDHTTILLRTSVKKDKVFISVRDSGIGIPKDDLSSIWDRFYKSDHSRGRDKTGTGLGLSICKEIITAHKETIDVVSTEGAGSTFTFRLPKS